MTTAKNWRLWLALAVLVAPMSLLLSFNAIELGQSYDQHLGILWNPGRADSALQRTIPLVILRSFMLMSWSWGCGLVLAYLSGANKRVIGALFAWLCYWENSGVHERIEE